MFRADIETRFLIALLLTWLIELPALFLLARGVFRLPGVTNGRLFTAGLLAVPAHIAGSLVCLAAAFLW